MKELEEVQLRITGLGPDDVTDVLREAEAATTNIFIESQKGKLFDGDVEEDIKTIYITFKIAMGGYKAFKKALDKLAKVRNGDAKVERVDQVAKKQ